MKVNIFGCAPWVKTGYGNNCRDLVEFLREDYEVCVTTFFGLQGGSLEMGGVEVNPIYSQPHSQDAGEWVSYWFEQTKSDLILQHFDVWILPSGWIKQEDLPVITYTPIDSLPVSDRIKETADGALLNVGMSRFAEKAFLECGMPSCYIPHWVDREKFYPIDKKAARRALPLPEEKFIFGMVGTNKGPRKAITNAMMAFKHLLLNSEKAREEAILYLHTNPFLDSTNPEGYRLLDLAEELEILDWVFHTDKENYLVGLPDGAMRAIYNSFDVLLQPSFGEGFGMPIVEAQACGVPVIGSKNSATQEVIGEGGWLIETADFLCNQKTNSWFNIASTTHLTNLMLHAFENRDDVQKKSSLALDNSAFYDKRRVKPLWKELFREGSLAPSFV